MTNVSIRKRYDSIWVSKKKKTQKSKKKEMKAGTEVIGGGRDF